MSPFLQSIQGTWRIVRALEGGREVDQGVSELVITGERFERRTPKHTFERRLVLQERDGLPAAVDLHITNEPGLGGTFLGIIELKADELSICHALPGKPRPGTFVSTPQNGWILSVSNRVTDTRDR
jgi:uncharacterized protein (TIGR03067 family)